MGCSKRVAHRNGGTKKKAARRNTWRFDNNKSSSNAPQEILGLFPKPSSEKIKGGKNGKARGGRFSSRQS